MTQFQLMKCSTFQSRESQPSKPAAERQPKPNSFPQSRLHANQMHALKSKQHPEPPDPDSHPSLHPVFLSTGRRTCSVKFHDSHLFYKGQLPFFLVFDWFYYQFSHQTSLLFSFAISLRWLIHWIPLFSHHFTTSSLNAASAVFRPLLVNNLSFCTDSFAGINS